VKRRIPAAMIAASACAAACALTACASAKAPEGAPAWYAATLAEPDQPYPELRSVPQDVHVNTDQAHWDAVAADVIAAREEMRANPRSEPAPGPAAQEADAFAGEARRDIEETRDTH